MTIEGIQKFQNRNVLIIEDEAMACKGLVSNLNLRNIGSKISASFKDAFFQLKRNHFDAIVVDLMLPEGEGDIDIKLPLNYEEHFGITLIKMIREGIFELSGTRRDVVIIVLTAVRHNFAIDEIKKYNPEAIFFKPENVNNIAEHIKISMDDN